MPQRLVHVARAETIADDVRWAASFAARLRGLIGSDLPPGRALVIEGAPQVHTFGLRYAIDVIFCDHYWTILSIVRDLRPWRVSRWVRGARYTIELSAGATPREWSVGDRLSIT